MESPNNICHVCGHTKLKKLFALTHEGTEYVMDRCKRCGLIQTVKGTCAQTAPNQTNSIGMPIRQEQTLDKSRSYRQWLGHVREFCRESRGRLLDIGCGRADFMMFAKNLGFEVFGFDSDKNAVLTASDNFSQVCCAASPVEYLKMLGKTNIKFDMVTMWDVLEHLENPNQFLDEIRQILKPGGLLFLSVPAAKAMRIKRQFLNLFGSTYDQRWVPWDHRFYFSKKALEKCVENSGFQPLDSGSVACYRKQPSALELFRRYSYSVLGLFGAPSNIYVWARLAPPIINPEHIPYRQKSKQK